MKFRMEVSVAEAMQDFKDNNLANDIATKFVDTIPGADGEAAEALREECYAKVEDTLAAFLHPGDVFLIDFDTDDMSAVLVPVGGETPGAWDHRITQIVDRRLMELGLRPNT